jgi:wyosine [tRNA(Phe)-imidazoG37] synthetase (radical SAM superfamily)
MGDAPLRVEAFARHPRDWRGNLYVYPVISRRSRGLSIGINLNPDTACNFDCIYCQVDRTTPVRVRDVNVDVLGVELEHMLALATRGTIFDEPQFGAVPPALRRVNDIAFSGDGEPTTCPEFAEAVQLAADHKRAYGLDDVRIVLITDACYLTRPEVMRGLAIMDQNAGEIWAKLDAGTQAYYELVNRPNYPLSHVIENIISAARVRPVRIQSLFMKIAGEAPSADEIAAFVGRLKEIIDAGGAVKEVQVYTVARPPAEQYVTPLPDATLEAIAERVRAEAGLVATAYCAA